MLTATSLIVMPALGVAKQRLGRRLDSAATAGEGIHNLLCAGQAAAVLTGWPSQRPSTSDGPIQWLFRPRGDPARPIDRGPGVGCRRGSALTSASATASTRGLRSVLRDPANRATGPARLGHPRRTGQCDLRIRRVLLQSAPAPFVLAVPIPGRVRTPPPRAATRNRSMTPALLLRAPVAAGAHRRQGAQSAPLIPTAVRLSVPVRKPGEVQPCMWAG